MAILSVSEISDGREGGDESGDKSSYSYTRIFRVVTNDNYDEAATILADSRIPVRGASYPYFWPATCRRRRASQQIGKRVWLVTCEYSASSGDKKDQEENPLMDPAVIEWSSENKETIFMRDLDGHAVLNSAGEYFDPAPTIFRTTWKVSVTKNLQSVPSWILTYANSVNSAAFTLDGVSIPARCARLSGIHISAIQERNDIPYRSVTLELDIDADTWDKQILDQGLNRWVDDGLTGYLDKCITDKGEPVTSPVLLDGNGAQLNSTNPDDAVYMTHKAYTELDFTALPLT